MIQETSGIVEFNATESLKTLKKRTINGQLLQGWNVTHSVEFCTHDFSFSIKSDVPHSNRIYFEHKNIIKCNLMINCCETQIITIWL